MIFKNTTRLKWILIPSLFVFVLSSFGYRTTINDSINDFRLNEKKLNTKAVTFNNNDEALRNDILKFSESLLGTPYVYAGTSKKGFDCSGFVYFVYKNFDINVPRSSSQFKNFGKEIPIAEVKKGDILLFLSPTRNTIGHIGIVSNPNGMESDFIHATSSKKMQVVISSLQQKGYTRRFVKAIRVL